MSKSNQRGLAMITTLGLLLLVSVLSLGYVATVRMQADLGHDFQGRVQAQLCARMGLEHVLQAIYFDRENAKQAPDDLQGTFGFDSFDEPWMSQFQEEDDQGDIVTHRLQLDSQHADYQFEAVVIDGGSRINLNACSASALDQPYPATHAIDLSQLSSGLSTAVQQYRDVSSQDLLWADQHLNLWNHLDQEDIKRLYRFCSTRSYHWNFYWEGDSYVHYDFLNAYDVQAEDSGGVMPYDYKKAYELLALSGLATVERLQLVANLTAFFDHAPIGEADQDFIYPARRDDPHDHSFDQESNIFDAYQHICQMDPGLLINEVCCETPLVKEEWRTDFNNGGEYIELWNPFNRAVSFSHWILAWQGDDGQQYRYDLDTLFPPEDGIHYLNTQEMIVITDDRGALMAQHPQLHDKALLVEVPHFGVQAGSTVKIVFYVDGQELFYSQLQTGAGKNPAQSYQKNDPRDDSASLEDPTPGLKNVNYNPNVVDHLDSKFLFLSKNSQKDLPVDPFYFRYIYRGSGPWQYFRCRVSDVKDRNQNGILDDDEAQDLLLLKMIYYYDVRHKDPMDPWNGTLGSFAPRSRLRLSGQINLNTASQDVLKCLPGMNQDVAQALVEHRRKTAYHHVYDLLLPLQSLWKDGVLSEEQANAIFWNNYPLLTVQSNVFEIHVKGVYKAQYESEISAIVERIDGDIQDDAQDQNRYWVSLHDLLNLNQTQVSNFAASTPRELFSKRQ